MNSKTSTIKKQTAQSKHRPKEHSSLKENTQMASKHVKTVHRHMFLGYFRVKHELYVFTE